jgi:hypothetical protein
VTVAPILRRSQRQLSCTASDRVGGLAWKLETVVGYNRCCALSTWRDTSAGPGRHAPTMSRNMVELRAH